MPLFSPLFFFLSTPHFGRRGWERLESKIIAYHLWCKVRLSPFVLSYFVTYRLSFPRSTSASPGLVRINSTALIVSLIFLNYEESHFYLLVEVFLELRSPVGLVEGFVFKNTSLKASISANSNKSKTKIVRKFYIDRLISIIQGRWLYMSIERFPLGLIIHSLIKFVASSSIFHTYNEIYRNQGLLYSFDFECLATFEKMSW